MQPSCGPEGDSPASCSASSVMAGRARARPRQLRAARARERSSASGRSVLIAVGVVKWLSPAPARRCRPWSGSSPACALLLMTLGFMQFGRRLGHAPVHRRRQHRAGRRCGPSRTRPTRRRALDACCSSWAACKTCHHHRGLQGRPGDRRAWAAARSTCATRRCPRAARRCSTRSRSGAGSRSACPRTGGGRARACAALGGFENNARSQPRSEAAAGHHRPRDHGRRRGQELTPMHPILADRGASARYLAAWGLLGALVALLLVLRRALLVARGASRSACRSLCCWASSASARSGCAGRRRCTCRGCVRSLGTQLVAAALSRRALARGRARLARSCSSGSTFFPGLVATQLQVAPLLLGLGFVLFLLTAALTYLLMAIGSLAGARRRRALQAEIASREAELRALRAQIQPHFLFNSLNSINALIAAAGPRRRASSACCSATSCARSLTLGPREAIPLSRGAGARRAAALDREGALRRSALAHDARRRRRARVRWCRRSCCSRSSRTRSPTASRSGSRAARSGSRRERTRRRAVDRDHQPARRRRARPPAAPASACRT